ncbi:N-6 DNA methylase [Actinomadura sp. 6K520]|uniref:Eco57I restriction-modification methylase domain-containing protein n=1 Tax=Actinomadura sp. 6K520 TaxID=2530364 RepID=UPI00104454E9|nr:N-6 DNA methylase [Actinomadura sp. 6K520]TDE25151.1 restriction endonuclease [Actinomadura sp. 6K520]
MLNITVAGTFLSTYYLSDPGLFLRDQHGWIGAEDADEGIRTARRELRRLIADIDETSTVGQTRQRMLTWLACFGWRYPTTLPAVEEPVAAHSHDQPDEDRVWILIAPAGQHLDAARSGRRTGKLRPQRQAEVCAREGALPAVLLSNGSELRVIRRDPGLGGEASYLTVDLAGLADLGDDHEWRVLWALLRPEAFPRKDSDESLWDRVEAASVDAATSVSENLSGGVRTAITAIANGALTDWRRRDQPTPAPRDLFADGLKIAYRLLFVAYAEDRGLLPVGTPAYDHGYALRTLRRQILDPGAPWEPDSGYLWNTLRAQWGLLRDGTDAGELQITGFNGGLFDPDKCPLLDDPELTIGDTFVRDVIDALSYTEPMTSINRRDTVGRRPVNYRELGVEQLGSIYEGLLSFEPQIADAGKVLARVGRGQSAIVQVLSADRLPEKAEALEQYEAGSFYLFEATGQRKGSGSYYTARPLAHFVVGETLRPLVENATPEQILNLRVCDPAMGSGAFLVPAVHQLTEAYGEALARAGEALDHKLDDTERAAYRRLIVERCIYGVDLNPMAVELAKVSLWLATMAAGKPLSFLDAHLRCGDAVIGASLGTWEGVPTPAQGGRNGEVAASTDNDLQPSLFDLPAPDLAGVIKVRRRLATAPSDDRLDIREKEQAFARLIRGDDYKRLQALGDWWVAPFFENEQLKRNSAQWISGRLDIEHGNELAPHLSSTPDRIRDMIRPLHWEVEFPEVFYDTKGERRPDAGFDAVIGNPPWEGITFKAAEFYGRFDSSYSLLKKKNEKLERQAELEELPEVRAARAQVDAHLAGAKRFIGNSGAYRMLYSHGTTFNYYRTFLERELTLLAPGGRVGLVIDSGVVSDAATAEHRRELLERCTVEQFVLCDNVNGIFPIHRSEQFLLLVAKTGGATDPLPYTSDVSKLEHLLDLERRTLPIPRATIEALAPETLAIPDTRDPALLDLLTTIYAGRPYFLDKMEKGGWQIDWGRELDLHDDRKILAADGTGMPLREGKHIHQYVHDFSAPTYFLKGEVGEQALVNRARKRAKKKNVNKLARHVGERGLLALEPRTGTLELPADQYRPCFREVARPGDERTLIAAVMPPGNAVTHALHYFYRSSWDSVSHGYRTVLNAGAMVYVVALMNSLVWDFIVRRKASAHVTKSIMATLPVPDVPLDRGAGAEIVRLSGRLTCRGTEFDDLAEVLDVECGPLTRELERDLRAQLDARVAHLYGLSEQHLGLVLADFRQSADREGSPVRPDEAYKQLVRMHFARLTG